MNAKAEQKERTRGRILESAARLLRTGGIAAASVADVMLGAGLTVGGFYAHFPSKEALVEETLTQSLAQMRETMTDGTDPGQERLLRAVERYLSRPHRDHPEVGCPMPAMLSELGHRGGVPPEVLAREIEEHLRTLGDRRTRPLVLGCFALMFGGVALARALRGTKLADEVLTGCRELARTAIRADRNTARA